MDIGSADELDRPSRRGRRVGCTNGGPAPWNAPCSIYEGRHRRPASVALAARGPDPDRPKYRLEQGRVNSACATILASRAVHAPQHDRSGGSQRDSPTSGSGLPLIVGDGVPRSSRGTSPPELNRDRLGSIRHLVERSTAAVPIRSTIDERELRPCRSAEARGSDLPNVRCNAPLGNVANILATARPIRA